MQSTRVPCDTNMQHALPPTCGWCYAPLDRLEDGGCPTSCSACTKRAYCCESCRTRDLTEGAHATWCGITGEVGHDVACAPVEGKGMGMFATRCFVRGEKILVERAACTKEQCLREGHPQGVSEGMRLAAARLMPTGTPGLLAKFELNDFEMDKGVEGLFIYMAYANHSCLSNAAHHSIASHPTLKLLVASRSIEAGEEICHSYIGLQGQVELKQQGQQLQRTLQDKWGFMCTCAACTEPIARAKRDRMLEMEMIMLATAASDINVAGAPARFDAALDVGEALIALYDDVGCSPNDYARTYFTLFTLAVTRRATLPLARRCIELAREHREIFVGKGTVCGEVRRFEGYAAHPESHNAYLVGERLLETPEAKATPGDTPGHSHDRGALLEILAVTASRGWERALKRIKRDEFGHAIAEAIVSGMVIAHSSAEGGGVRTPHSAHSERAYLDSLRAACASSCIDWSDASRILAPVKPAEWPFTYVRLPADDAIPAEELHGVATKPGDTLCTLLASRFAATAKSSASTDANGDERAVAGSEALQAAPGCAETFALCRPSSSTRPAPFLGTYLYLDEIGAVKRLPPNRRAHKIALACGCDPSSPFYGDVYVGRVLTAPSPARQADFHLADLDPAAEWLLSAPAENRTYLDAMRSAAGGGAVGGGAVGSGTVGGAATSDAVADAAVADAAVEQARSLMQTMFTGMQAPLSRTVALVDGLSVRLDQSCDLHRTAANQHDPTGGVIWRCGLALCAHLADAKRACDVGSHVPSRGPWPGSEWDVTGKRVLELGSGTGVVGLAAAVLGAASVCLTDLPSQMELLQRNVALNRDVLNQDMLNRDALGYTCCDVSVAALPWDDGWQLEQPEVARRARAAEYDCILASDCVYGSSSASAFASVVLSLLRANAATQLLLAYEERPLPDPELDYGGEFFETMAREGCELTRVKSDLTPELARGEVTLWCGRLAFGR